VQPPCGQPPGVCLQHARQGGIGGDQPPFFHEQHMVLLGHHLEAVALVLPQFVDRPLPILVGAFRAGASPEKDGPPGQFWRQQAGSLLVFAKCLLEPFLVAKGTTSIGRGIEFLKIVEYPVGGAWGRQQPFIFQPPRRIGEGGQGQMSRR
jgi:hypothetical protein